MPGIMTPRCYQSSHRRAAFARPRQGARQLCAGDDKMLIVTSDRLSAFDVILPDPIPWQGRGADRRRQLLVRQVRRITSFPTSSPASTRIRWSPQERARAGARPRWWCAVAVADRGRGARLRIGSGWKDYQATGRAAFPAAGLKMAQQLPEPFHASPPRRAGDHDENIDYATVEKTGRQRLAKTVRDARCASTAKRPTTPRSSASSSPTPVRVRPDAEGRLYLIDGIRTSGPVDQYQEKPAQFRQAVRARPWKRWTRRRLTAPGLPHRPKTAAKCESSAGAVRPLRYGPRRE